MYTVLGMFCGRYSFYITTIICYQIFSRRRAFENYAKKMPLSTFTAAICERGERPEISPDCPESLAVCTFFVKCLRLF